MSNNTRQWAGNTGGGNFGRNFLLFLLRFAPVQVGYFFMAFAIPVYLTTHLKERDAIYYYFRRRHHYSKLKAAFSTVRNHFIFGKIVIDKFAVWARGNQWIDIQVVGTDYVKQLVSMDEGFMILGAHVGNFELAGYAFPQHEKKIYTVVYEGENKNVQSDRQTKMGESNVVMVPVSDDGSHIFTLNAALDSGDIVSMTCDRVLGSDKTFTPLLLGERASFPSGAFRLAAAKNVKTVALFALKGRGKKYKVLVKPIEIEHIEGETSAKKAARLAEAYAQTLENVLNQYPLQWFNFYNFWED